MKKLILVFLLISGLSGLVYSDTLSSLREKARFILKDTGPSSSEYTYTDTELNYWLNDAQRKVVNRMKSHNNFITRRFHITTDSTTTAGYSLPSDFNEMRRVWTINTSSSVRTSYTKIMLTDFAKLDKDQTPWDDVDRDEPTNYYLSYTTYNVTIHLYPMVDTTHTGTDYLRIDYIPNFADMSADGDNPFNNLSFMVNYHDLLIHYTIFKCLKSIEWLNIFEAGITLLNKDLNIIHDRKGKIYPSR